MEWVIFAILLALVAINVPIGFALSLTTIALIWVFQVNAPLTVVPLWLFSGAAKFPLLAIPLFVLAGNLMNTGGISRRLINLASALVGFVRGGLAMVNVAVSMFFAEISGSAVADVAAIGTILIPAMKQKGYPSRFAAAVTSSSASLAIIIPPSIPMILYAVMAESSVAELFLAGFAPGLLGGLMMMAVCYFFAVRNGWPVEEIFGVRKLLRALREAVWALTLPVIVLGGIIGGIMTATEAAGAAVLAAFVIGGLIYRELTLRSIRMALLDSSVQTAVVMVIVAGSALLGWYLTNEMVPQRLAAALTAATQNKYLILLLLNLFLLFIGVFLHSAAAIILVVPIVMPLVRQVGIDPTHFGIIVTLNLAIGQQTPPVASVLITTCSIAREPIAEVMKDNIYFIGVLLVVLALVTYVEVIPMFLVRLFF